MCTHERFRVFHHAEAILFADGNAVVEISSMECDIQLKLRDSEEEHKDMKTTKRVIIITSTVDDSNRILSKLNSSNVETMFVNLNDIKLIDQHQMASKVKGSFKRSLSQSLQEQAISFDGVKSRNTKKRKADLTCVVCEGEAIGYNFDQITCESCKAFFRRNALQPLEKTKCALHGNCFNGVRCDIRYDIKQKCRRCRLLKCFQTGMRKDFLTASKTKQSNRQFLGQHHQLTSESMQKQNSSANDTNVRELLISNKNDSSSVDTRSHLSVFLTESDRSCLAQIQRAYIAASQSTPSASSVMPFDSVPDKTSAFVYTIDVQNFTAIKLIKFLRDIPEFRQLNEQDRITLVKYNLMLLLLMHYSLHFDSKQEICYDLDMSAPVSPTDEAFAHYCKSLFILCYGYEFNRTVVSILRVLTTITNKDLTIGQLLMLIMIFSKGLSADDEQEPTLNDEKAAFFAQSKYIDLLFRYLLDQSSFEAATMKITRITEQLLNIQKVSRDFQLYIKNKVDLIHINPLMKSLLNIT